MRDRHEIEADIEQIEYALKEIEKIKERYTNIIEEVYEYLTDQVTDYFDSTFDDATYELSIKLGKLNEEPSNEDMEEWEEDRRDREREWIESRL